MGSPVRRPALAGAVIALALGAAACGSSAGPTASTAAAGRPGFGGRFALLRDPKVAACLRKQGVQLPARQRRLGPPPAVTTPRPRRPFNRAGFGARFAKVRQALQKCGVTLPRPQGAAPPPAPAGAS